MPNTNIQFQGQTLPIPGSYFADDVSAALPANPALVPPMVFIAYGYGGVPMTAKRFSSGGGQALLNALRGAPSADFVPFISNPSTELFSASEIIYINCSQNTRSSLALKDSGAVDRVGLVSTDYGPPSNLLMAEVSAGTSAGVFVTIFDGYTGTSQQTADNLGVPMQIAYVGAASGVTMTITSVSGVASFNTAGLELAATTMSAGTGATTMTLSSPIAGESVTVGLGTSQYETVGQLAAYINTTGHFVAQVLPNQANARLPTQFLDQHTAVALPVPTGTVYNFVNVNAGTGSVIFWINQYVNAANASGVVGGVSHQLTTVPLTHFAGAAAVAPTLGDYADAFGVAATLQAWVVVADSNNAGVVALGVSHAEDMNTPGVGKWRRFITGSSAGDTVSQAQSAARRMNSHVGSYVYPGVYRTNLNTGNNTLYDGNHVAAAVASMMAGNVIATPLTLKSLVGNGVESLLSTGAGGDIDLLQQAGVMPLFIDPVSLEPTIVSDMTTWQNDNNPENVFNQQVACRHALGYSLSQGLQPYVGDIASPFGLAKIRKAAVSILNKLIWSPGNNGILVSWDHKSLKLLYDGSTQTVNLTVNVVFVGQVRFILELVFVQPLNLAA